MSAFHGRQSYDMVAVVIHDSVANESHNYNNEWSTVIVKRSLLSYSYCELLGNHKMQSGGLH